MKHGEIRWDTFALPDKTELSCLPAQTKLMPLRYKKRPVLILTRDSVLEYLAEVTIAPITTTVPNIPSEVFLSMADGMPRDYAVNCHHLQTVAKGKIGSLITSLPRTKMVDVARAIRFARDL